MTTSASAADSLMMPVIQAGRELPLAGNVLVVTARPGQESAELGGLLYAFRRAGASLELLCLTRGEASPLNSTWCRRLEAIRPWELQLAANVLGISGVTVASYPDGGLRSHPVADLTQLVRRAIRRYSADLLLVIAPEAGDPDDTAVALAACAAARQADIPVVARTEPGDRDAWMIHLGADAATARAIQKSAAAAHQSQSDALPELIRRLDLLDGREALRWLVPPSSASEHDKTIPAPAGLKVSAGLGAGLITAGLAAAGTVPVHDRTTDHAAATTSATADEPTLREGSRNATPSELAAKEMPPGPEIAVDGLFGPAANAATQVVPL